MDPVTVAGLAVGALVRYVATKAAGLAGRAGRDVDAAVDERLDQLYSLVRGRLGARRREGTLDDIEAKPNDARLQGRLELALEEIIEAEPDFAGRLKAILEDLDNRPPARGVYVRDSGPVAGGNVTITAGRDAAGRDLRGRDGR